MKLHDWKGTPNGRRVYFFLAEKDMEIEYQHVDLINTEHKSTEFLAGKNPFGQIPILELDDGSFISESVAICRYFEASNPQPALMGATALEQATIEMWQRQIGFQFFGPILTSYRNSSPFFEGREEQFSDYAANQKIKANQVLDIIETRLSESPWIAGDQFTIVDITAIVALEFGQFTKIIPKDISTYTAISNWQQNCMKRKGYSAGPKE